MMYFDVEAPYVKRNLALCCPAGGGGVLHVTYITYSCMYSNSGIWKKNFSGYCDDMPVSCMRRGALSPSPCTVLQTCSCTWLPFLTSSNTSIYLTILASGDHHLGSNLFAAYQVECVPCGSRSFLLGPGPGGRSRLSAPGSAGSSCTSSSYSRLER
jgi:hypothetical protein